MAFPGVRAAMQAIGGGNITEQEAFNREQIRLTRARSASADMDFKVSRAVNEGLQTDRDSIETAALRALQALYGPNLNEFQSATLGNRGTELNASKSAFGKEQANIARQIGLDALLEGDPLNATRQNAATAIAGDSLLGPTNVRVVDQADADILRTTAMTNASNRSNPADKDAPFTKVTDEQMFMALGDDPTAYAAYYSWLGEQSINDASIRHNSITLARYVNKLEKEAIDALGKSKLPPGFENLSPADQKELLAYRKNDPRI